VYFILSVLGYMTVILSGFLIVNTVTAIMTQQTRQIGIMKAVGGGNGQIFRMYVVLVLGFGLMALAIAVPLGDGAAQNIGAGMAAWLNFHPAAYKGYPSTLIQQAIVALGNRRISPSTAARCCSPDRCGSRCVMPSGASCAWD
jgi:putative ABC transport system permease protein